MFDIISFGSATRDVFLRAKDFQIRTDERFATRKGLCLPLGAKVYLDDIFFSTGGCGTNCAASFALQGLKTAYVGAVGLDSGGQAVMDDLKKLGVATKFIKQDKKRPTSYSLVLYDLGQDRTILVYRGASHFLTEQDIPWREIEAPWFYLGPLSGQSKKIIKTIIKFCRSQYIQVAANLGSVHIKQGLDGLAKDFKTISILFLNQEEAVCLAGLAYEQLAESLLKIAQALPEATLVITRGPEGVLVLDKSVIFEAGIPDSGMVERTGAGDAFAAGFLSVIVKNSQQRKTGTEQREQTIVKAIQLGTANATACLQKLGAKNGLLRNNDWGKWEKVEVKTRKFQHD